MGTLIFILSLLSTSRILSVLILHPPFILLHFFFQIFLLAFFLHRLKTWHFQVLGRNEVRARGREGWRTVTRKAQAREWLCPVNSQRFQDYCSYLRAPGMCDNSYSRFSAALQLVQADTLHIPVFTKLLRTSGELWDVSHFLYIEYICKLD